MVFCHPEPRERPGAHATREGACPAPYRIVIPSARASRSAATREGSAARDLCFPLEACQKPGFLAGCEGGGRAPSLRSGFRHAAQTPRERLNLAGRSFARSPARRARGSLAPLGMTRARRWAGSLTRGPHCPRSPPTLCPDRPRGACPVFSRGPSGPRPERNRRGSRRARGRPRVGHPRFSKFRDILSPKAGPPAPENFRQ